MKIAVTGATGVLGQEATEALVAAGHEVTGVTRQQRGVPVIEGRGAKAVIADVFSQSELTRVFRGHDVVINTLAKIPAGMTALRPLAWREDDKLHQEASVAIAAAAADADIRQLIQESSLFMYPDNGDKWIAEDQALNVRSSAFRPRVREMRAAVDFAQQGRTAVILRLGQLYGRDPVTTDTLRKVRSGAPVLLGKPSNFITLLHHHDAGLAFVRALSARSGFYNVGGEPIRRERWAIDLGREAKADGPAKFHNEITQRALNARMDVQRRSLRVSSRRFMNETGWRPTIGPSTLGWSRM